MPWQEVDVDIYTWLNRTAPWTNSHHPLVCSGLGSSPSIGVSRLWVLTIHWCVPAWGSHHPLVYSSSGLSSSIGVSRLCILTSNHLLPWRTGRSPGHIWVGSKCQQQLKSQSLLGYASSIGRLSAGALWSPCWQSAQTSGSQPAASSMDVYKALLLRKP